MNSHKRPGENGKREAVVYNMKEEFHWPFSYKLSAQFWSPIGIIDKSIKLTKRKKNRMIVNRMKSFFMKKRVEKTTITSNGITYHFCAAFCAGVTQTNKKCSAAKKKKKMLCSSRLYTSEGPHLLPMTDEQMQCFSPVIPQPQDG